MRFGLRLPSFALGPETASLADMGAYLRRAEDLGFESALLIDHLLVAPPAYRTTWLEPISLLSALSGVTRTIRLGTIRCSRSIALSTTSTTQKNDATNASALRPKATKHTATSPAVASSTAG